MQDNQRIVAFCPHCCNRAPQRVLCKHDYATDRYGQTEHSWGTSCQALFCVCETCDEILLYDGRHPDDVGDRPPLVHPTDIALHESVAQRVRIAYGEAARVKATAPNAYAVMIRRSLEAVCHDRGATEGPLIKRLGVLEERGEVPPLLAEVTDLLRTLGNAAAHDSGQSLTPLQARAIDEFFRVLVEYLYVAPYRLAELKKALAQVNVDAIAGT